MNGTPAAAVFLRTDTEEQLTEILLSLSAAVERAGAGVHVEQPADTLGQRIS